MSETVGQSEQSRFEGAGETLVHVEDLKTYYGVGGLMGGNPVKAVDGVNFQIQRGETLGLVGESGCGKSTLGRTLVQLEDATQGRVLFDGTDITKLSGRELKQWRRNAQIVFQDPQSSLNDRMTVGELVREPLDVHAWKTPRERRQRVKELLSTVGLKEEHYYRYPHQFSGGQRQRIGIARALALEPEFIVLDEPVSALDVSVQAKILNLLEDLQDEFGLTYLFIAHDLSVVRHICDRVAVMYLGHIMELGPTEELFTDPANPYTHSLLSAIPEPDPTSTKERVTLRGSPPSPRDPPNGCPFTTRCPAKIPAEEIVGADPRLYDRLEEFREVLRERSRVDMNVRDKIRSYLDKPVRFKNVDEVVDELFAEFDVPPETQGYLDEIVAEVKQDNMVEARQKARDMFGSECDQQKPEMHTVSNSGRRSYCHRHKPAYDSTAETLGPISEDG